MSLVPINSKIRIGLQEFVLIEEVLKLGNYITRIMVYRAMNIYEEFIRSKIILASLPVRLVGCLHYLALLWPTDGCWCDCSVGF